VTQKGEQPLMTFVDRLRNQWTGGRLAGSVHPFSCRLSSAWAIPPSPRTSFQ
jgi:hypothetical protein